jgi:alpha-D-ribose 1-methylphosphonate 5-triphosphate synthase subunit PhnH
MPTISADWQNQTSRVNFSAMTFRLVMDSLARPGKINRLSAPSFIQNNVLLNQYAVGVMLTLLDGEVSFAVAQEGEWLSADHSIVQWLKLRSGAQAIEPGKAHFALFCDGFSNGRLLELNSGTILEPENSTTAIYCVQELSNAVSTKPDAITLELRGAGIADRQIITVSGLSKSEVELFQQTRQAYPLGIDIFLIDQAGNCVGLPRTTEVRSQRSEIS